MVQTLKVMNIIIKTKMKKKTFIKYTLARSRFLPCNITLYILNKETLTLILFRRKVFIFHGFYSNVSGGL